MRRRLRYAIFAAVRILAGKCRVEKILEEVPGDDGWMHYRSTGQRLIVDLSE